MEDYVLNPKTSRLIKVGSRLYNSLICDGLITLNEKKHKDKFAFTIESNGNDNDKDVQTEILPTHITLQKGKGVYKDRIVKIHKKKTSEEWINLLSKIVFDIATDDKKIMELQTMDLFGVKRYIQNMLLKG